MIKMDSTLEEYGDDPLYLYGKRIFRVTSHVGQSGNNNEVKRCSNWYVVMNTVDYLQMCQHYILFQNILKTRLDVSGRSM